MDNIQIDMITSDNVVIKTVSKAGYHTKAYINSLQGREELQQEVYEPYLSEVFEVWAMNLL